MEVSLKLKKLLSEYAMGVDFDISAPEYLNMGDLSTNLGLVMRKYGKTSQEVKDDIEKAIISDNDLKESISKIEIAGGGFINIWYSQNYLIKKLLNYSDELSVVLEKKGTGKTIVVDYSSPNIAKSFSIGHLRSTIIGQAIINLSIKYGYSVIGDNHLGDWGTQFGKLLYMIDKMGLSEKELTLARLESLYVEFHELSEKDDNSQMEDEARAWFKKLEDGDEKAKSLWESCVKVSMKEFDRIYDLLGVKFDKTLGESFYEEEMKLLENDENVKKELKEGEEGSIIIDLKEYGIKTPLLFKKKDGATTYATRDLACIRYRMRTFKPDIIIYEVGQEQKFHFEQVFAAARKLKLVSDEVELVHVGHGLYLGEDGKKFKTRKGGVVKLDDILTEAIDKARDLISSQKEKIGEEEKDEIAKSVGIGAIKFFDLSHHPESNILFSWESVFQMEGKSAPYIQYTIARINSLIAKSQKTIDMKKMGENHERLDFNELETEIIRYLSQYQGVLSTVSNTYSPNLICNFLYGLSQKFNTFYNKHKIVGEEGEEERIVISRAVKNVLTDGLTILGIDSPERM